MTPNRTRLPWNVWNNKFKMTQNHTRLPWNASKNKFQMTPDHTRLPWNVSKNKFQITQNHTRLSWNASKHKFKVSKNHRRLAKYMHIYVVLGILARLCLKSPLQNLHAMTTRNNDGQRQRKETCRKGTAADDDVCTCAWQSWYEDKETAREMFAS